MLSTKYVIVLQKNGLQIPLARYLLVAEYEEVVLDIIVGWL